MDRKVNIFMKTFPFLIIFKRLTGFPKVIKYFIIYTIIIIIIFVIVVGRSWSHFALLILYTSWMDTEPASISEGCFVFTPQIQKGTDIKDFFGKTWINCIRQGLLQASKDCYKFITYDDRIQSLWEFLVNSKPLNITSTTALHHQELSLADCKKKGLTLSARIHL